MIDFQIMPRSSGKTSEIVKRFNSTGGFIVQPTYRLKEWVIREYMINPKFVKVFHDFDLCGMYDETFYFDDILLYETLDFRKLIDLDQRGCDVIIRTSNTYGHNLPRYFTDYCGEHYPEYCI